MGAKTKILLLVTVFLLGLITFVVYKFSSGCDKFYCFSIDGLNDWKIEETFENDKGVWRGIVTAGNYRVRIYKVPDLSMEKAEEISKTAKMNILGLFDTAKSPYPGVISDKVVCADEFKPKTSSVKFADNYEVELISSNLNSRMQYGDCNSEQLNYKVYVLMFYCKNSKSWLQTEFFTDFKSSLNEEYFNNLFKSIRCK